MRGLSPRRSCQVEDQLFTLRGKVEQLRRQHGGCFLNIHQAQAVFKHSADFWPSPDGNAVTRGAEGNGFQLPAVFFTQARCQVGRGLERVQTDGCRQRLVDFIHQQLKFFLRQQGFVSSRHFTAISGRNCGSLAPVRFLAHASALMQKTISLSKSSSLTCQPRCAQASATSRRPLVSSERCPLSETVGKETSSQRVRSR